MNDFLTREVLIYDYFNKLDEFYIIYPKLEDFAPANKRLPGNGSINTLLENFIDSIQAGFPSTVHTVLNTLNKIKPKMDEKKICPICWGKKDKLGNILEDRRKQKQKKRRLIKIRKLKWVESLLKKKNSFF